MNKSLRPLRSIVAIIAAFSFVFVFAGGVNAASTIGTNMSTTGTLTVTPASDSATSIRFQNAAGSNILTLNSTLGWVGIGGAPQTTFEVQGTSSASFFFTQGSLQVAGTTASVAYSRFGTGTTGHATDVSASNDLLITGSLEVDGPSYFDSTASVAGAFEVIGRASASSAFVTTSLVVGSNTASNSLYTAEFGGADTATVSILFGGDNSSKGTCLQMKNTIGAWVYARIVGTTWTVNSLECNTQ
jgi:hypothetical protein